MQSQTRRGVWEFSKAAVAAKITLALLGRIFFRAAKKFFLQFTPLGFKHCDDMSSLR